jgi:hypothetical protein
VSRRHCARYNRIGGVHPSHLWGGKAHRERSERLPGGGASASGVLAHGNELPPSGASRHPRASFARLDPTSGRDKNGASFAPSRIIETDMSNL